MGKSKRVNGWVAVINGTVIRLAWGNPMVYWTKSAAEKAKMNFCLDVDVVPCVLTYTIPTRKKRGRR